jgi:hypothetical protein
MYAESQQSLPSRGGVTLLSLEEDPLQNAYMSRREQNSSSWISRILMPGMTALAVCAVGLQSVLASGGSESMAMTCGYESTCETVVGQ